MPIVAEHYTLVIGGDTHAATHTVALVNTMTAALIDQAVFPNTAADLDRAVAWISRRTVERLVPAHCAGAHR